MDFDYLLPLYTLVEARRRNSCTGGSLSLAGDRVNGWGGLGLASQREGPREVGWLGPPHRLFNHLGFYVYRCVR